jgi:rhodanese-related sulfurtransferase
MLNYCIRNAVLIVQWSVAGVAIGPSASELLDAYAAGQERIASWAIRCQLSIDMPAPGRTEKTVKNGQDCDLRSDGARASVRCHKWHESSGAPARTRNSGYLSRTWDGEKYMSYRKAEPNGVGHVFIDDMHSRPAEEKAGEINALLYGHPAAVLLGFYGGTFERVDSVLRKAQSISVRESTERVGDNDCYVIDARTLYGRYTIWIDPQHGSNVARAQIIRTRDEGHLRRSYPPTIKRSSFTLENVRFEEVQGVWVAVEADFFTQTEEDRLRTSISSGHGHVRIDEITLHPDHDALRSFTGGDIPNGTDVLVMPALHIRYAWTNGELVTQVNEKAIEKVDRIVARLTPPAQAARTEDEDANGLLAGDGTPSPPDSMESEPNAPVSADQEEGKEAKPRGITLPRPYCGLYCVYAMLKQMDRNVDFRDLVKLKYVGSGEGSTMAELSKAARDNGLFAGVAARLSTEGLSQCPYPAILHVKADWSRRTYDHYELFLGTEEGQAKLFDPPDKLRLVPFHELAGRWDGYALAVSDKPFDIDAIFGPDRQRLLLYVALGILAVLGVHLLVSRTVIPRWAATRRWRLGLSVAQAGALAVAALVSALICHVSSREGLLVNTNTTGLFREAYLGTFIPKVGVGQVRRLLKTDAVILDARYKEDYQGGHLTGAISLPTDANEALWRTRTEAIPKNARILVYCQSAGCKFAEQVGSQLRKDGFSNISVFRGGWQEWTARNGGPARGRTQKDDGADPNGRTGESVVAGGGT